MLLAFADGAVLRPSGPPATGLQVWFKADAGVITSGPDVTAWQDQSGNGHGATTTVGTPVLLIGSSGINGLPAIRFNNTDGNNRVCYLTSTFDPSSWAGMTVIYVSRTPVSGSIPTYASVFGWQSANTWWAFNAGSDIATVQGVGWAGVGGNVVLGNSTGITNNQVIIEAYRYDKTAWNMSGTFTDGPVADTSFPTGPVGALIGTNTYAGTQYTGDIAEILVYDHKLSDADLAAAMSYANGRYVI
jgi:hypothetical protein